MASPAAAVATAILLLGMAAAASAQLSATFYDSSCPSALSTIRSAVTAAVTSELRMGASLLRLHFHDCFGCDASVLLADTANFVGEQSAFPNVNSLRGLDVIAGIKSRLEAACARTVSCADIVAVAARDSIAARDSTTASFSDANKDLPPPSSDLSNLIAAFYRKGLSTTDMVALSGAHTFGQSQCANFRSRIYGESNVDAVNAAFLRLNCPQSGGDRNLAPLDVTTPNTFDNGYYVNLLSQRGLLHSDQHYNKTGNFLQQLFSGSGGGTDSLVRTYAFNSAQFFSDFAAAMGRMGRIGVLTGSQGQIRVKLIHICMQLCKIPELAGYNITSVYLNYIKAETYSSVRTARSASLRASSVFIA
ncbi:hypothetical protein GUJ93_ZPchr0013g34500 [Zizania palustris]|uniref:peroxidase n=1 Tax=Zizania palustris TaxID=103762 RepID=A0A8J6BW56_ZIZPA|nr:hypothetical protein GUJ93_ZPchr0013g34500 [Zizania palustris]